MTEATAVLKGQIDVHKETIVKCEHAKAKWQVNIDSLNRQIEHLNDRIVELQQALMILPE